MEALRVEGIVYGYEPGKPVIRGVSFTGNEGEVIAILGPNGAGKSTLLRLVLGAHEPWRGTIKIYGRDACRMNPRERARIIAWVPQEPPSIPLSVLEYVLLGRAPHLGFLSIPGKEDIRAAEAVLKGLDMWWARDKPVMSLSGGEKQLVMIAKALVQESRILLLDEPTSHLDIANKIRVLRIIRSIRERGALIVFTTHDPNEAVIAADKTILLSNGVIKKFGPTREVVEPRILSSIYGVELGSVKIDDLNYILPIL